MNINKLRGKIVERGMNVGMLATRLGIDRATLYRKMKDESFTVREAVRIAKELGLTSEEVMAIFFNHEVA